MWREIQKPHPSTKHEGCGTQSPICHPPFSNFASSCLNAAKRSMNPPGSIVGQYEFPSVLQRLVEEANLSAEQPEGPLWAFKSQSGNPPMSQYWTFGEGRPSTAVRANC